MDDDASDRHPIFSYERLPLLDGADDPGASYSAQSRVNSTSRAQDFVQQARDCVTRPWAQWSQQHRYMLLVSLAAVALVFILGLGLGLGLRKGHHGTPPPPASGWHFVPQAAFCPPSSLYLCTDGVTAWLDTTMHPPQPQLGQPIVSWTGVTAQVTSVVTQGAWIGVSMNVLPGLAAVESGYFNDTVPVTWVPSLSGSAMGDATPASVVLAYWNGVQHPSSGKLWAIATDVTTLRWFLSPESSDYVALIDDPTSSLHIVAGDVVAAKLSSGVVERVVQVSPLPVTTQMIATTEAWPEFPPDPQPIPPIVSVSTVVSSCGAQRNGSRVLVWSGQNSVEPGTLVRGRPDAPFLGRVSKVERRGTWLVAFLSPFEDHVPAQPDPKHELTSEGANTTDVLQLRMRAVPMSASSGNADLQAWASMTWQPGPVSIGVKAEAQDPALNAVSIGLSGPISATFGAQLDWSHNDPVHISWTTDAWNVGQWIAGLGELATKLDVSMAPTFTVTFQPPADSEGGSMSWFGSVTGQLSVQLWWSVDYGTQVKWSPAFGQQHMSLNVSDTALCNATLATDFGVVTTVSLGDFVKQSIVVTTEQSDVVKTPQPSCCPQLGGVTQEVAVNGQGTTQVVRRLDRQWSFRPGDASQYAGTLISYSSCFNPVNDSTLCCPNGLCCGATHSPTALPTVAPTTILPTTSPTTIAPTTPPTPLPTPTNHTTMTPTLNPTTASPSPSPTTSPTSNTTTV